MVRNTLPRTFVAQGLRHAYADQTKVTPELVDQYRDLQLGLVDATVMAATEMLGETKLATLDHPHFGVVHPAHTEALTLLP